MLILCIRYDTTEPARYMLHNLLTYTAGEFMRRLQGRPRPNSDRMLQYQSCRQREMLANGFFLAWFVTLITAAEQLKSEATTQLVPNLHGVALSKFAKTT